MSNAVAVPAALYVRVSTKDKGQDVENQLLPLRAKAKESGWTVIREYIEHESAAGKVRRRQFADMMQAAENGEFKVLAFWSLDRFSREGVAQTLFDLRRLDQCGVLWYSHMDKIPGMAEAGPFRDVIIALMAALAQLETNRRSERAKAAIERKRAAGEHVGSVKKELNRNRIEELIHQGFTHRAIAKDQGVSRATIISRLGEWGLL
jgi:DNA invertase Pin-like site-specific DNA recombinase